MDINRFNPYKVLLYKDRIEKIVEGELPAPVVWHVYPTNSCVLKCKFCIMRNEQENYKHATLSDNAMMKMADDCVKHDIKMVHMVGGGEPTLHRKLIDSIEKIYKNNVSTALSTNLVPVCKDNDKLKRLASSVNYMRVSLNAGNKEIYKHLSGVDKFEDVMQGIEIYNKYRKDVADGRHHDLATAFIITHENWLYLYEFCRRSYLAGCDFVHIRPAYDPEHDADIQAIIPRCQEFVEHAKDSFGKSMHIQFSTNKFEGYWSDRGYDTCRATPLGAVLAATGEFILCLDVFDQRFGNYNENSFEECWFTEEHKEAIKKIDLSKCPRCVYGPSNEIIQKVFINDDIRRVIV